MRCVDGGGKKEIIRDFSKDFSSNGLLTRLTRRVNARISQLCVLSRYIKREHERGGNAKRDARYYARSPLTKEG